jgi:Mn-dependent DtxR family transcriptional regulator
LARWLLICADRARTNSFKMSHEFLTSMLGGGRPTVTTTAGILKERGLIEYSRGQIQILDIHGLKKAACECYSVIKRHLNNYTEFDTGITA